MNLTRRERSVLSKYADIDAELITAEEVGLDDLAILTRLIQWQYASGEPTESSVAFGRPGQFVVHAIAQFSLTENGRDAIALRWRMKSIHWIEAAVAALVVGLIVKRFLA